MIKPDKSVTLIELLVGIVLMTIIVLGLGNIDFFSRFHVLSAERRAKVQNEVSHALEHMSKQLVNAIGDINLGNNPLVRYADNRGFRVRIDSNGNGSLDPLIDTWIAYRHINDQILFFPNAGTAAPGGTSEVIANNIVITNPAVDPPNTWGLLVDQLDDTGVTTQINRFNITVRARWNPAAPVSSDNPEVVMQTSVIAPSVSIN